MENVNVYFNRCFTDTSKVIEEIVNNKDNINYKIFISHPVENKRLEVVADYYEIEPVFEKSSDYAKYCISFCIEHNIDIFVPRYRVEELVLYKDDFLKNNIKVLFIGNNKIYDLLNNKGKVYEKYKNSSIIKVPPFKVISTYNEFVEGYKYIKDNGFDVCIKPIVGIGAEGFKVIKENTNPLDELAFSGYKISLEHLKYILKSENNFPEMLLSGVLPGNELSVDCLACKGKLIDAVTRIKSSRFVQTVKIDKTLNKQVEEITKELKLDNLFNVQFKMKDNEIYLLEINTRMSAGIFKSCKIGINFLHKAIMKELDKEIQSEMDKVSDVNVINVENTTVVRI